jgi:hypothetical protein
MISLERSLLSLGGVVLVAASALGIAASTSARPDCPGKITCPLTGEVVCRDQCPNVDPDRADCPGRIECPLTGELVCADRCPLEQGRVATPATEADCCRENR